MLLEKTRKELKPSDFVAGLFICVVTENMRELTSREPIARGQDSIMLPVIECGRGSHCLIFDRANGGEHLLVATIRNRPTPTAWPGDTIRITNLTWSLD
jgi:hypothetical protein